MAKNGTQIDSLYLSLGLDITELELGFDTAGKTVSQTISKLNSQAKQIKLKADIDLANLEGAGSAIDQLKVKEQALTAQIDLQKKKVDILANAYKQIASEKGAESPAALKAQTTLLYQQKDLANMQASLRNVNAELGKSGEKATSFFGKIKAGATGAKAGIDQTTASFGALNAKYLAIIGVMSSGAGLFKLTESAMLAGENVQKLSERLHVSTAEASSFARIFSIAGQDVTDVIPLITRLDKQVVSAGASGNTTTRMLAKFGISLTDATGKLLPLNDQMAKLAEGYRAAAQAGEEEEFAAGLGARAASLIPILQNYNELMETASKVTTTGLLNPQEAKDLARDWRVMNAESGQLKMALGAALMPVAKELMPEVTESFKGLISYIKDNKDEIKDAIKDWADVLSGMADAAALAAKGAKLVGEAVNSVGPDTKDKGPIDETAAVIENNLKHNGYDYNPAKKWSNGIGYTTGAIAGGILGASFGGVGAVPGAAIGAATLGPLISGVSQDLTALAIGGDAFKNGKWGQMTNASDYEKQKAELIKQEQQAVEDFQKAQAEATAGEQKNTEAAKQNAEAQKAAIAAVEERKTATGALKEEIYKLTHTDLENSLHDLQYQVTEARANGVDEATISAFSAASTARIQREFRRNVSEPMAREFKTDLQNALADVDLQGEKYKEAGASDKDVNAWMEERKRKITADWDKQITNEIDSVWKSEYENQLTRIDQEKQAWIQKGLDEVKATEWAEEKKKQIQQQNIKEMFTSQMEYLRAYRAAIANGEGVQGAQARIAALMRKKLGIDSNEWTTPDEIAGFQQAMKMANENLIPVYPNGTRPPDGAWNNYGVDLMRGTQSAYVPGPKQLGEYSELPEILRGTKSSWDDVNPYQRLDNHYQQQQQPQYNDYGGEIVKGDTNTTINVSINQPWIENDDAISRVGNDVAERIMDKVSALGNNTW